MKPLFKLQVIQKIKNDELVESHTTLFENFEQLRETHKVTSSELAKIK